jgi:hypothetical protein
MPFPRWSPYPLKHLCRALCLVALLMAGQQGAVVHELAHLAGAQSADLHAVDAREATDGNCALCPLFSQVATAAFSHSLQIPALVRAAAERVHEPEVGAIEASVPTPRSRGPPFLS